MRWHKGWQYCKSYVINATAGAGTNQYSSSDITALNIAASVRLSNGCILAHKTGTKEIYESTDDGATWSLLSTLPDITNYNGGNFFLDSGGRLFISVGGKIFRSIDNGVTWSNVCTLTGTEGWRYLCIWNFCEDADGNLYGGKYKLPQETTNAEVWKSTNHGATWSVDYSRPNSNHMHGIGINPYNGYIYVCVESSKGTGYSTISRLKDGVWSDVYTGTQLTTVVKKVIDTVFYFLGRHRTQLTTVIAKGDSNDVYFGRDQGQDSIIYKATDIGEPSFRLAVHADLGDYGFICSMTKLTNGMLVVSTKNNSPDAGTVAIFGSTNATWTSFSLIARERASGYNGYQWATTGSITSFVLIQNTISGGYTKKIITSDRTRETLLENTHAGKSVKRFTNRGQI